MRAGGPTFASLFSARVAELADAVDSKSTDESLVGSTPTPGTSFQKGSSQEIATPVSNRWQGMLTLGVVKEGNEETQHNANNFGL